MRIWKKCCEILQCMIKTTLLSRKIVCQANFDPNILLNSEKLFLFEQDLEILPENTYVLKRLQYIQQCKSLAETLVERMSHTLEEYAKVSDEEKNALT